MTSLTCETGLKHISEHRKYEIKSDVNVCVTDLWPDPRQSGPASRDPSSSVCSSDPTDRQTDAHQREIDTPFSVTGHHACHMSLISEFMSRAQ